MEAVILAAGQGKRLRPITEHIPKAMVLVNEKPMLQIILDQLRTVGVTRATIVVHYKKEKIITYFGKQYNGITLNYAEQDAMTGDAHAILCAKPYVKEDKFILVACDNLFPTTHIKKILNHNSDGVMSACNVSTEQAKRMGVLFTEAGKVTKIIEKSPNPPSTLANAYLHYMPKAAFDAIPHIDAGAGGEFRFVDAIQHMINNGKTITYQELDTWLDIGTPEQLEEAQKLAKNIL